jgi:chromosome segregation protein
MHQTIAQPGTLSPVSDAPLNPFPNGSGWLRTDFHLHTRADKEFAYAGAETEFVAGYVDQLKQQNIRLGVITNHNKFNVDEFKALRKRARKESIGLLPGVELSVNDGANGVHTLVVFSEEWLADGQDYINQFLNVAFTGKTPAQYEHENGRTNDDLLTTLKLLDGYNRDFFVVFAHVEAASGLWNELHGGRMEELAQQPLVQKYCLGFQKVRTHDKPGAKCRIQVQKWWGGGYPAEVEGSDPKKLEEIGRGRHCYLKIGDLTFGAVKFALTDFEFRVAKTPPKVAHSHLDAVRFEGGMLDGGRVAFSPHLNCLIGIQGSGKSSILESLRYALDIPFGDKAQDRDYKEELLPYVLKSGGKIVVEATDRHGTKVGNDAVPLESGRQRSSPGRSARR